MRRTLVNSLATITQMKGEDPYIGLCFEKSGQVSRKDVPDNAIRNLLPGESFVVKPGFAGFVRHDYVSLNIKSGTRLELCIIDQTLNEPPLWSIDGA